MYHEGELAIQRRAGVLDMAERIGRGIRETIAPAAMDFLSEQRFAVLGWGDAEGRPWASVVVGEPGFLRAADAHTAHVEARPSAGDPLADVWPLTGPVGLLAIDFETRRRMRVNGRSAAAKDGGIDIAVRESYSNCPKYIQIREIRRASERAEPAAPSSGNELGPDQIGLVERSDTFFVASYHRQAGADASHRGGMPGFVRAVDGRTLRWADYVGNTMFQTLGNIEATGRAGLLFVDFENGTTLQITGSAEVIGSEDRIVEFRVDRFVENAGAFAIRGRLLEYSPFNPA